ncbi:MAG: hypothetical protein WEA11_06515 [Acidimicrobiales bacterium]
MFIRSVRPTLSLRKKTSMSFVIVTALALTIVLSATACSAPEASAVAPSYLFVFTTSNAMMEPVDGATDTFTFLGEFDCEDIADCAPVTWFTDRPVRDSGTQSVKDFANQWQDTADDGFKADPPNVAIEIPPADGSTLTRTLLATMSGVRLVRNQTTNEIALLATMTLMPNEDVQAVSSGDSHLSNRTDTLSAEVPTLLGIVSVFVDPEVGLACVQPSCSSIGASASTTTTTQPWFLTFRANTFIPFTPSY